MIEQILRKKLSCRLTGQSEITLHKNTPSREDLILKFYDIKELGLYLHIPFCDQICPYCPYKKEIYEPKIAKDYTTAVIKEIDIYSDIVGKKPVTSFYIGGGTPTTMLHSGLGKMIERIFKVFNMQCDIHVESHPNHLNSENLNTITSMGIHNVSLGVESLQDKHLQTLKRPYTVKEVKSVVDRVVNKNFKCVNLDFMFALPDQTFSEIEEAGNILVKMGVNQVASYPLFRFPYTKMGSSGNESIFNAPIVLKRRKMIRILENIFYNAGFERSSVWAFTKRGIPKYCSVTVPLYIGLGASGGSYLNDIFYLNTFSVLEYIKRLKEGKMPFALSLDLSVKMQMAGWLYWRIYETKFSKNNFEKRFSACFDNIYGKYMKFLQSVGFLKDFGDRIVLSDKGTYWLHAFEDLFSIDYISTLWGTAQQNPWPERVKL